MAIHTFRLALWCSVFSVRCGLSPQPRLLLREMQAGVYDSIFSSMRYKLGSHGPTFSSTRQRLGPLQLFTFEMQVGSPWPHLLLCEMQVGSPWLHLLIRKKQVPEPLIPEGPSGWDISGFYSLSDKRGNCQEPKLSIREGLRNYARSDRWTDPGLQQSKGRERFCYSQRTQSNRVRKLWVTLGRSTPPMGSC